MGKSIMRKSVKFTLIACNVAFALLYVLSCFGTRISANWIIGLLTLGAFYLFLINVVFLVFWLFAKRKLALISLFTVLICWYPMSNVFKLSLGSSFETKKNSSAIRVMDWNVELFNMLDHKTNPGKKEEIVKLIRSYNPDIACFQEMVATDGESSGINNIQDISESIGMPYYHYAYKTKFDFDQQHHFGIVIFSKFPILREQTIASEEKNYNSVFQYADLLVNNDTIRVFNIHLQSLHFNPHNRLYLNNPSMDEKRDLEESKSILRKFKAGFNKRKWQSDNVKKEINKSPYPVILCGDFNDVPNSYVYNNIGNGMVNAFEQKGSGIGTTYSSISSTLRIDNIFVSPVFQVTQFTRVKKNLSDHYPLIADIQKK
jgi:endonuclease/exonuclease/phosphatase family metal-dependent hydrolase